MATSDGNTAVSCDTGGPPASEEPKRGNCAQSKDDVEALRPFVPTTFSVAAASALTKQLLARRQLAEKDCRGGEVAGTEGLKSTTPTAMSVAANMSHLQQCPPSGSIIMLWCCAPTIDLASMAGCAVETRCRSGLQPIGERSKVNCIFPAQ